MKCKGMPLTYFIYAFTIDGLQSTECRFQFQWFFLFVENHPTRLCLLIIRIISHSLLLSIISYCRWSLKVEYDVLLHTPEIINYSIIIITVSFSTIFDAGRVETRSTGTNENMYKFSVCPWHQPVTISLCYSGSSPTILCDNAFIRVSAELFLIWTIQSTIQSRSM